MAAFDPTLFRVKNVVDLSLPISADTAMYPGDPSPRIEVLGTIDEGGANLTRMVLSAHTGTHVDVPYHLFKDGKSIDELPLEKFCGSALTYDLARKELGSRICPDDLETDIPLRSGEIALFYTRSNDPNINGAVRSDCTCLDATVADWMIDKRVKAVGIDSMSVDPFDSRENEVHKKLLKKEIIIFENLSNNLRLLVGKRAIFFGMPLRLERAEASLVRAFALR